MRKMNVQVAKFMPDGFKIGTCPESGIFLYFLKSILDPFPGVTLIKLESLAILPKNISKSFVTAQR